MTTSSRPIATGQEQSGRALFGPIELIGDRAAIAYRAARGELTERERKILEAIRSPHDAFNRASRGKILCVFRVGGTTPDCAARVIRLVFPGVVVEPVENLKCVVVQADYLVSLRVSITLTRIELAAQHGDLPLALELFDIINGAQRRKKAEERGTGQ